MSRPLTERERAVLDTLMAADFPNRDKVREQAKSVRVVSMCGCGCPSIEFIGDGDAGLTVLVDAHVQGTRDGLMLYAIGDRLAGLEYISNSEKMASEMPDPSLLTID